LMALRAVLCAETNLIGPDIGIDLLPMQLIISSGGFQIRQSERRHKVIQHLFNRSTTAPRRHYRPDRHARIANAGVSAANVWSFLNPASFGAKNGSDRHL